MTQPLHQADKAARKAAEDERREAATWAEGADGRSAKRRDEQERKAQERDAKKAELKALMEAVRGWVFWGVGWGCWDGVVTGLR